jgi:hypothetical protein
MRTLWIAISIVLLSASLVMGAAKWRDLIIAFLSSASYFPDFPYWPLWLPLGLLVLGYMVFFLLGASLKRPIGSKHGVMVVAVFVAVLTGKFAGMVWPAIGDAAVLGAEAPPRLRMARAADRLKSALDRQAAGSSSRSYPVDPSILEEYIMENKRLPRSGYRSHGFAATVQLVVFCGAQGPVLQVRPEDRAGTIYYAVSEDAGRYWITMVGLRELPAGETAILTGADNQPVVLKPESRLQTGEE